MNTVSREKEEQMKAVSSASVRRSRCSKCWQRQHFVAKEIHFYKGHHLFDKTLGFVSVFLSLFTFLSGLFSWGMSVTGGQQLHVPDWESRSISIWWPAGWLYGYGWLRYSWLWTAAATWWAHTPPIGCRLALCLHVATTQHTHSNRRPSPALVPSLSALPPVQQRKLSHCCPIWGDALFTNIHQHLAHTSV